jgi:hypothetical protein
MRRQNFDQPAFKGHWTGHEKLLHSMRLSFIIAFLRQGSVPLRNTALPNKCLTWCRYIQHSYAVQIWEWLDKRLLWYRLLKMVVCDVIKWFHSLWRSKPNLRSLIWVNRGWWRHKPPNSRGDITKPVCPIILNFLLYIYDEFLYIISKVFF